MKIEYPSAVVQVPGPTGSGGGSPIPVSSNFNVPAAAGSVQVTLPSTASFQAGQNVFINGGNYLVVTIDSPTTLTLEWLAFSADTTTQGTQVLAGSVLCPGTGYVSQAPAVPISIANGGTGQTTQSTALTALLGADAVPVANGGTGVKVASAKGHFSPGNPSGTTSATAVMMGLGGTATITPLTSGKLMVMVTGMAGNSTIGDGASAQLYYGTGAAPSNAGGPTGTAAGAIKAMVASTAAGKQGFALSCLLTGLTVGVAYWFDIALLAVTGGTASIYSLDFVIIEL